MTVAVESGGRDPNAVSVVLQKMCLFATHVTIDYRVIESIRLRTLFLNVHWYKK